MGVTIGNLAKATGVKLETIRYYERIGLMPTPARASSGFRNYGPEHTTRLTFIRRGREIGFTIADIRALLNLAVPGEVSCAEVRNLAYAHLDAVRAKLADLGRLEVILADTVARCSGAHAAACPVLDMLNPSKTASLEGPKWRGLRGSLDRLLYRGVARE